MKFISMTIADVDGDEFEIRPGPITNDEPTVDFEREGRVIRLDAEGLADLYNAARLALGFEDTAE